MKISREWLQDFFVDPLPESSALADALTFHAFEIESVENDILDVKVTANRGHDCLSYRGIAKEIAAILRIPLKADPFRQALMLEPQTHTLAIQIDEPTLCRRFVAAHVRGVQVGASPAWLAKRLEAMGQKSINNVVDATNYVMFHLGQPIHAFDAGKLAAHDGAYAFTVRKAHEGETMRALDAKVYTFAASMLLVTDGTTGTPLGIAGIKGGEASGITEATSEIVIECANFESVNVRKTAQALKLRTDASSRFEQGLSQEMTGYTIRAVVDLVKQLAGGELVGYAESYPITPEKKKVSVTLSRINAVLGTSLKAAEVSDALQQLDLAHTESGETFEVHAPFERLDLEIAEDLIEEIGRMIGYDQVPAVELPALSQVPAVNQAFAAREAIREALLGAGFSEVFTSVFAESGERVVANKVDGVKPYLRAELMAGLREALDKNVRHKDLFGESQIKIFEIGTVWRDGAEIDMLAVAVEQVKKGKSASQFLGEIAHALGAKTVAEMPEEVLEVPVAELVGGIAPKSTYDDLAPSGAERYQPFSKYPFIVRDVAFWVPGAIDESQIREAIARSAGDLLVRLDRFDRFEKEGRVSYAFRLVFQSPDRTLFDGDAEERMESVHAALKKEGYEIR